MKYADAISIASLYLALVGLLATFFFIQLSQWLNSIRATETKWNKVKNRPIDKNYDFFLDCFYEANQLSSKWTLVGWGFVSSFLIVVLIFLEVLRFKLSTGDNWIIYSYVSWPTYIFLFIYFFLSACMLFVGYRKIEAVLNESNAKV